ISRREGLKLTAASAVASLLPPYAPAAAQTESPSQEEDSMTDNTAIRPFQVNFAEADLTDLLRRVKMTRWPERELVNGVASRRTSATLSAGDTQGVQLATMQKLIQYWGTEYDWG